MNTNPRLETEEETELRVMRQQADMMTAIVDALFSPRTNVYAGQDVPDAPERQP